MGIHQETLGDIVRKHRQRQGGIRRLDKQMYERVSIVSGTTSSLNLFTKSQSTDGLSVTNFPIANQIANDTAYLFLGIAVDIESGAAASTRAAAATAKRWLDAAYLESKGYLTIRTGNDGNIAFEGGPLRIFPGNAGLDGPASVADTTTAGAANQTTIEAPRTVGRPLILEAKPILLLPGERVTGTLDFGSVMTMPSASNASLLIRYLGIEFQNVNKSEIDKLVQSLSR